MEYIQPQQYPGAFSDTEARVLATISKMVVWMPATSDLNGDQLRALLALRNAGYIEYAAFGGYRVKGNPYTVARASEPDAIDFTGAARISVSANSHRAMIVWRDGRKPTEFAEGTAGYAVVVDYGKANGLPTVWRMQGTISYVFAKIAS